MILKAAAATHVGHRRQENEDCFAVAPHLGLYLVADGMGGHSAGQVASQLAAEASLQAIESLEGVARGPAEKLREAVTSANQAIFASAADHPEYAGMGTTVVALLFDGAKAGLVHVGDSRAYRIRQGRIRLLTEDHSVVAELLRHREIGEEEARDHPHRHVLTRALGVRRQVEPDVGELEAASGDLFVLCSDGLNAHVEDEEIAQIAGGPGDPQKACERLVELANERGGEDNTTVVVVRCE
jgi:PPM family protein phosphatase